MSDNDFNEKRKMLIKKLEGLDVEGLQPEELNSLSSTMTSMVSRLAADQQVAWNQSYTKSSGHAKTHDQETPDPNHSKSWSEAIG